MAGRPDCREAAEHPQVPQKVTWDRRGVLSALRFLNLLEPGKNIVSITKSAMWICVAGFGVHMFTGIPLDLTSTVAFFSVSSLYAWRRFVQWKTGVILPHEGDTPESSTLAG